MGFPSPAQDYVEVGLDWNTHLIQHPAATFPVKVAGKAMEPLIAEDSYVIVDKSLIARNNDIIVAIYRDEFIIRKLIKSKTEISLVSENPKFPRIQIQPTDDFQIWGVVTFSVQQHRDV